MGILKYVAIALFVCVLLPSTSAFAAEKSGQEPVSVCISCHLELGDEMAKPVTLWETSIHHQMGNSCDGCHGGDPTDSADAMNPEKGFLGSPKPHEVAEFCGKCHVGVKENYMKSPHYTTALEGGMGPNCITCHQSHDVKKASFELINETLCGQCHSYENGKKIKGAFVSAEMALKEKKDKLRYLGRRGMPVKRMEEELFALRNSLHQMTHTLNLEEIQNKTQSVLEDLKGMDPEIQIFEKRIRKRWWMGGVVAGFLIILIFLLFQLLRTYEEEE